MFEISTRSKYLRSQADEPYLNTLRQHALRILLGSKNLSHYDLGNFITS
jgi:hypothetical protein